MSSEERPRGWPLIDAVIAWGNYDGFRRASKATELQPKNSTTAACETD
jgi:hypothetical protein